MEQNKFLKLAIFIFSGIFLFSCNKNDETIKSPAGIDKIDFPAAYVVNGWDNTISVIDLRDDIVKKTIQLTEVGRYPHHIDLSPDKSKIVVAIPEFDFTQNHSLAHDKTTLKGGIVVIDAVSGKILNQISLPKINHNTIFSPNGKEIWAATLSHSADLYVFNSENGKEINKISIDADPTDVVFSKNGKYAFFTPTESSHLQVFDVEKKVQVSTIKVDLFPTNVWSGADGKIYVENKNQKSINIINAETLKVEEAIDLDFIPGQVAYNQLLNELWVCRANEDKVAFFVRKNNIWELKGSIQAGLDVHSIAFTNDDKLAYIVNQQANTVSVIDVVKHLRINDISVGKKPNGIILK